MSDGAKPPAGSGRYSGPDKLTTPLDKSEILEGLMRSMQREIQEGFNGISAEQVKTNAEVERVKTTIHMVVDNQKVLGERVGNLEQRARLASGNIRAVKVSDDEQGHALELAQQKSADLERELRELHQRYDRDITAVREEMAETKRLAEDTKQLAEDTRETTNETKALTVAQSGELERQTATLNRLATIAGNPLVKDLARAVGTAILTLILGWLATGGHK